MLGILSDLSCYEKPLIFNRFWLVRASLVGPIGTTMLHTHEVTGSSPVVSTSGESPRTIRYAHKQYSKDLCPVTKLTRLSKDLEDLCNGSTPDSDSVCGGSNPSSSAKKRLTAFAVGRFLAFGLGFEPI